MAKERKKQREEETAVCILEWMPQGAGKRQVLLVKRPEKGRSQASSDRARDTYKH